MIGVRSDAREGEGRCAGTLTKYLSRDTHRPSGSRRALKRSPPPPRKPLVYFLRHPRQHAAAITALRAGRAQNDALRQR